MVADRPRSEQFYAWTPYNSNLDNPVRYQDRDGKFPWWIPFVIAALVGGGVDYGFQVAQNVFDGKEASECMTDVNLYYRYFSNYKCNYSRRKYNCKCRCKNDKHYSKSFSSGEYTYW